jgi:uncharacterized alkaline shock family protein YloU
MEVTEPLSGTREPILGTVRVANEVIASIACLAARDVDGVVNVDQGSARHFGDWIKRETAHNGVRVAVDSERRLHLEVFLVAQSSAHLHQLAGKVQDNVVEAVERILGLDVAEVDVFVSSVSFLD